MATAITAVGALLGGLALPLAFVQLGALRQDRLRAQVAKIGAWAKTQGWATAPEQPATEPGPVEWAVQPFIRNSSELPVTADTTELSVRPWGYNLVPSGAGGERVPGQQAARGHRCSSLRPGNNRARRDLERRARLPAESRIRPATATNGGHQPRRHHRRRGLPVGDPPAQDRASPPRPPLAALVVEAAREALARRETGKAPR